MKRIGWIDVAKGIGIILVILGHMPSVPSFFRLWIFSFHMPLFFFVSGYLFKAQDHRVSLNAIICRKAKKLLIPYLTFSVLLIMIDFIVLHISFNDVVERVVRILLGQGGYDILWFFFSLFLVESMYSIIEYYSCKSSLWAALFGIVGLVLSYFGLAQNWKISASLVALFFYSAGKDFKRNENRISNFGSRKITALMSLLVNVIVFIVCFKIRGFAIDMNNSKFALGPLSLIGAMAGIILVYEIAVYTSEWKLSSPIKYIGKYSIFFFPITSYVPNLLIDFVDQYIVTNPLIKIISKVIGFVVAAGVSAIYATLKRRKV